MVRRRSLAVCVLSVALGPAGGFSQTSADRAPRGRAVTAADVATFPPPGTAVPGSFAVTQDGKAVTYLNVEAAGPTRVLWRAEVAGGAAKVIARPPGRGDTDANVSQAEALRRERMRLRDSGITQVVRAEKADVAVVALRGDLFVLRGDRPLERVTETAPPEIDPHPSPDGTKAAFVRGDELFVVDLSSKAETQLTRGAKPGLSHGAAEFVAQEELDRFSGFWWSPDGSKIAYQETDERHIPLFPIVHQGGESWSVEQHRYPFAGAANARARLGVIPARGGDTTWLNLSDTADDDHYLARVNWESPESLLVQVLSRDQKSLTLYRFNAANGSRSRLHEETSTTWVNLHDDLRVLEKSGQWLWSSERTGYRHLELRDRDGKLVRTLTEGDSPVDEVLAVDEARREVWFGASGGLPLERQVFRVSLDGGLPRRMTPEPGTHRATVARDGRSFVDVHSTLSRPPVTTLRDRDGAVISTLHHADRDPRVTELQLVPPVLTEFRTRDNKTLFGAYYAPRSRAQGDRAPVVVMVYGGPHVQTVTDSWGLTADLTAQFLAGRGFAVWKADNRGSARRGHAFETPLYRSMGTVEVRDQVDGVRFLTASRSDLDAGRVGITGGSYGGYMTLRGLTLAPEVFRAGVAVAPVTDWDGYDTAYTERYMGTPRNNRTGYKESSVLPRAGDLRGSLLVVHGMLDENVHFRHSARLANALIGADRDFTLLPVPDSRHSSRREADRKYQAERLAEFFATSLAPTRP
jgi:dipeptidyl-peptidase-4